MNRINSWLRLGTAVVNFMPLGEQGAGGAGGGTSDPGGGGGGGDWKEPDGLPEQFRGAKSADELVGKMLPAFQPFKEPDGLPDQFKGAKDAGELIGKLLPAYTGAREALSKMPGAPKSVEEYKFTPSEKNKAYFPEGKDDPFMNFAKEQALKNGIPVAGFTGFVNGLYEMAAEKGLLAAPFDEASEIKTFNTALGLDDKGGATALNETYAFAEGLMAQLKVPETQKDGIKAALIGLTDTAHGNLLLHALRGHALGSGIKIGGGSSVQGVLTAADLKTLSADPRIDPKNSHETDPNKRYDPELRKKYDEGYQAIYGNGGRDQ